MVAAPVVPVVSRRNGITITENGNSNITGLGVVVVPCAVDRMINIYYIYITRRNGGKILFGCFLESDRYLELVFRI